MVKPSNWSDAELPDEWIPHVLRGEELKERKEVVYACGWDMGEGSYGMFAGPYPTLEEALDVVPDHCPCPVDDEDDTKIEYRPPAYLIRFNKNGTENPLYKWSKNKKLWRKL